MDTSSHVYSDLFVVIDLDRTIFNTDRWIEMMFNELSEKGAGQPDVVAAAAELKEESRARSVDLLEYLVGKFGEAIVKDATESIRMKVADNVTHQQDQLLIEGSDELFALLRHERIPHGIVTFGSLRTQTRKLELAELLLRDNIPKSIVTDHPRKAVMIAEQWKTDEQGVTIDSRLTDVPVTARNIVIIDDKIANLRCDRHDILGILVDNTDTYQGTERIREVHAISIRQLVEQVGKDTDLVRLASQYRPVDK